MQVKPFISKSCSYYLHYDNYPDFVVYQSLSGLGQNRLGNYYECIQNPNNQYFLIQAHRRNRNQLCSAQFMGHQSINIFQGINQQNIEDNNFTTGFCWSKDCSSSDLTYLMSSAQKYYPIPFQIDKVIFPAGIKADFDGGVIVTLIIITILVGLCITSTILKIYFKRIKYKKEHLIIECFSLQNTIRLISYNRKNPYDQIRVFSGVKFLMFIGIVFSHMVIILMMAPSSKFGINVKIHVFYIAFYCIDVWLAISGFFLSYIALKQYAQYKSVKVHLLRIVRRFLRFWPLYIIIVMFTWNIAPFIGNGPLWGYAIQYFERQCGAQILNYLLLVQNFSENSCNSWLWIWEIDIQLCLIFTPLLLLYCKMKDRAWKILFFSIQLILVIISIIVPPFFEKSDNIHEYFKYIEHDNINISPLTRMGAYMIGYNLGILFYQFRTRLPIEKHFAYRILSKRITRVAFVLFALVLLGLMTCFLTTKADYLTFKDKMALNSFHLLFPLIVCILISPPLYGFNSLLKQFLQSSTFGFLSKISMSAYGVHFIVQVATIYSRKTDLYLNNFQILLSGLYSFVPIFVVSIFFTALLEMPFYMGKKIYLKTPRITYFEH